MLKSLSDWPTPPYFSFETNAAQPDSEPCQLHFIDGKKAAGELKRISTESSKLLFLAKGSDAEETIELDQIKTILLARPVTMKRELALLEERAEELVHSSERQTYNLLFTDNHGMSGETVGFVDTSNALYLYMPKDDKQIIRCFIPKQAIAKYQIGMHIGEMLIQENLVKKEQVDQATVRQQDLRGQRLGDYLSENKILSREQLDQAINLQGKRPILKLGEALQELGLITDSQLNAALAIQKQNRKVPLGQILVEMGAVQESALKSTLAKKLGIPYVGLEKFNFDLNVIKLITVAQAKKFNLIPLCMHGQELVVAFDDPLNAKAAEEIRFLTQKTVLPVMSSREEIQMAISRYYPSQGVDRYADAFADERVSRGSGVEVSQSSDKPEIKIDDLASKLFSEDDGIELTFEPIAESDNTLVQLVNKMILDAHASGVSDIHIETYPGKKNTRVRFRKDGTLSDYLEIPANFREAIISRIKIMAQLDISTRRKPQDGKIDFQNFGPAKIELRVATIPTTNNLEDIVMRVLAAAKPLPIDKLGLSKDILESLKHQVGHPYGLVLVCGPTGSGKTTTLHSLLGYINTPERKIWTAEDPVEITQPGLRQVQVNSKIGWTFASAIRSFLRADPDVIMVGEMRDQETTKIGIEASLTGHLVLSTLHTNTAPESVIRLLDLGMDPFNFADALLGVLAQRLAKSLCSKCKEAYTPEQAELDTLLAEYVEGTPLDAGEVMRQWQESYAANGKFSLYKAKGCPDCGNTGYRGRIGLHELMTASPAVKHLIQTRAPVSELQAAAIGAGMRTLKQDGIAKVLQGFTDITQVRSVCV